MKSHLSTYFHNAAESAHKCGLSLVRDLFTCLKWIEHYIPIVHLNPTEIYGPVSRHRE